MKWLLFIFLFIALLILLVAITRLTIFIEANHSQDDDHIKMKFSIWFGLIKYTINVPMVAVDKETPSIVFKKEKNSNIPIDKKRKRKNSLLKIF
ncbi:hypothetical protein [Bacillus timonensis]|uniref:hypothetical protein n=1 Tax=Bacillus timonensis TaxID=1033734 RepID=UPI0002893BE2|nr:hypothetical protein [Bacillus timonensis]